MWDGEHSNFLTVKNTKEKFKLSNTKVEDWNELTDKIHRNWSHVLEEEDTLQAIFWIGFYIIGKEDPKFDFQCITEFTVLHGWDPL